MFLGTRRTRRRTRPQPGQPQALDTHAQASVDTKDELGEAKREVEGERKPETAEELGKEKDESGDEEQDDKGCCLLEPGAFEDVVKVHVAERRAGDDGHGGGLSVVGSGECSTGDLI